MADTFTDWMRELNQQVVARNGSHAWTRGELDLLGLREAIVFFTGSVPTLTALGKNRYRVRAAGYYATIGA